ncbi:MAG: ribonuclease P protein component, partial [Bacilli bacterium]|nr:ribonuclease P protein component [Bacilli bacterium]
VIYNKERAPKFPRFGLAVGKKIGNAVTRNRVKRQIRSIIDNNKNLFKNSKDYIIIVKRNFLDLSFQDMERELKSLLEK